MKANPDNALEKEIASRNWQDFVMALSLSQRATAQGQLGTLHFGGVRERECASICGLNHVAG